LREILKTINPFVKGNRDLRPIMIADLFLSWRTRPPDRHLLKVLKKDGFTRSMIALDKTLLSRICSIGRMFLLVKGYSPSKSKAGNAIGKGR